MEENSQSCFAEFNVKQFGAKGDGKTDDTRAIQAALDAAAEKKGTVYVPDGVYLCADLKVGVQVGLQGNPTWSYRSPGGSILKLNKPDAKCLVDITGSPGVTLNGLSLVGDNLGTEVHGILQDVYSDKKEEDAPRIERCQVSRFTGHGIYLAQVWCFSLRGSQICFNKGDGLYLKGWDGFILDNWFSGNGGAGISAPEHSASVTITGNRIEWNRSGGIKLSRASHYNITGNYIDRSGGPAITMASCDGKPCFCISVCGNVIYRSGKPEWTKEDMDSAHIYMDQVRGITMTGNTMCIGQDDGGGTNSPQYGMILKGLKNSIIKDNAMHIGAIKQLILDLGDHDENTIIKDNIGNLYINKDDQSIWASGQI